MTVCVQTKYDKVIRMNVMNHGLGYVFESMTVVFEMYQLFD